MMLRADDNNERERISMSFPPLYYMEDLLRRSYVDIVSCSTFKRHGLRRGPSQNGDS